MFSDYPVVVHLFIRFFVLLLSSLAGLHLLLPPVLMPNSALLFRGVFIPDDYCSYTLKEGIVPGNVPGSLPLSLTLHVLHCFSSSCYLICEGSGCKRISYRGSRRTVNRECVVDDEKKAINTANNQIMERETKKNMNSIKKETSLRSTAEMTLSGKRGTTSVECIAENKRRAKMTSNNKVEDQLKDLPMVQRIPLISKRQIRTKRKMSSCKKRGN